MSSKKLGGLDKRASNKRFNTGNKGVGIGLALSGTTPGLQQIAMHSEEVIGSRAGDTGTSSADRDERLAGEAAAQAERDRLAEVQAEAARKQRTIDEQNARDEEARKKLREAQGGGFAANILSGGGLTFGGNARRRLAGS